MQLKDNLIGTGIKFDLNLKGSGLTELVWSE